MKHLGLKLDLHVHSHYSADSLISTKELVFYASRRGLNGVAITDHDRLDGALKIAKETDFLIVPGTEVTTTRGHVIGLGVQHDIPRGLDVDETVNRIHDAGGLAVACHPTSLLKGALAKHVTSRFDAVEVINSSSLPFDYSVRRSRELALSHGIRSLTAGSDAHYGPEIGHAYTVVDAASEAEIIGAIRKGMCKPYGQPIPMKLRLKKVILSSMRK